MGWLQGLWLGGPRLGGPDNRAPYLHFSGHLVMIFRDLSLPTSSVIQATINTLSTVFTSDKNLTADATFYWPKFMFFCYIFF